MSLLTRNVTGHDVIAIRQYVEGNSPVKENDVLDTFFPHSPNDPEKDDQLKPLEDAIQFLVETNQLRETDKGYEIDEEFCDENGVELNLLRGIRLGGDETAGYDSILEHLVLNDRRLFDRKSELVDEMSDKSPELSWNETRLNYWSRVMESMGVIQGVDAEQGSDITTVIAPKEELFFDVLETSIEQKESNTLSEVMDHVNENFLPVYDQKGVLSSYMDEALKLFNGMESPDGAKTLTLGTESDMGKPVGQREYRSIQFKEEEA